MVGGMDRRESDEGVREQKEKEASSAGIRWSDGRVLELGQRECLIVITAGKTATVSIAQAHRNPYPQKC